MKKIPLGHRPTVIQCITTLFFMTFSLKVAYAGRPTSTHANDTVNIINGMATIPLWFLRQMMALTAITTWDGFLTLVSNQYNFQKAMGALYYWDQEHQVDW